MKNKLSVVICYTLFFSASHTASALTCLQVFKNPKKALSQVVDYISLQRIRRSIQSHQRSLIEATNLRSKAGLLKGEYHFDTLLRTLESPKLTIEQQRELKMKFVGILLTNYQKLYYKYGKKMEEWIYTNANSVSRDGFLTAAKNFDRSTDYYIQTFNSLNRVLLDSSSKEGIGFSPETLAYFDALPLKEKVELVGPSGEPTTLNSPKAQLLVESWGRSVRLHLERKKAQEKLKQYERSGNIFPLSKYISDKLGLDGELGYYNQGIMIRLMMREGSDTTSYQNPLVQQIYILVEHRLKNALSIPDKGRPREDLRLKEPSAIAILSILGELGRRPTILSEVRWDELRALVNQSFNPQIRAYLSSLLPTIIPYLDSLSSSTGVPSRIDIFANSNHNFSSFVQN